MKKVFALLLMTLSFFTSNCEAVCSAGFFSNNGVCTACHESCATCNNASSCLTCNEKVLNSTTGLCESCATGQYYDTPRRICQECGDSCYDKCAYQSHCFQCTGDEIFNLAQLECVTECESDEVYFQDSRFQNLKVCRGNEYYVDPESSEVVEIGTIEYPYKNIGLVFVELLNLRSHSDADITIYVKENAECDMQQGFNFIVNITSVTIESYSKSSPNSPSYATLFVRQYELNMFDDQTIFNLVSDSTLDLDAQINVDGVSDREITLLSSTDTTLFQFRSNLHLKNLRIQGDIENDAASGSFFMRPIYLQEKSLNLTNVDIQLTGMILRALDPMSMFIENVYVDFHAMEGGFYMNIECNYPEAYLDGILQSKNMTAENAETRVAAFRTPFLVTSGPEDIYFVDTSLYVWGSLSEDRAIVETYVNTDCLPSDDRDHTFTFIGTKMSQSDNPEKTKFTSYYVDFNRDNTRRLILNYIGGEYTDQYQMPYPTHQVFSNPVTEINIINATFHNVTGVNGGTMTTLSKSVVVENTIYEDCDNFGFDTFLLLESDSIILKNLTFSNVNGTGSALEYYVYMQINEGGSATLDTVNFHDCDLLEKAGLYFEGLVPTLIIANSNFADVKVGDANSILFAQEVSTFSFANCTFTNIEQSSSGDESMTMINFEAINLDSAANSTISEITIVSSTISFLQFNSIKGSLSEPATISFSDIVYKNCDIDLSLSLISFGNLETDEQISYTFDGITFSNISFASSGNLMEFQHQLPNPIEVVSSKFSDITGGSILIEAANKQNSDLDTLVNFRSTNFSNIFANYDSLMAINEGAVVTIDTCSFSNISTLEEGAVIFAGYQRAEISIVNSSFTQNYALTGGLFNIESESHITVTDSLITNNFAITSAVAHASNNGRFTFISTNISANFAISSTISQIFDSANPSYVSGCEIYGNIGLSVSEFERELSAATCDELCFFSETFRQYLLSHSSLYTSIKASMFSFQLIIGSMVIDSSTLIHDQDNIVDAFQSSLTLNNCSFYDIRVTEAPLKVSSTTLAINDVALTNITEVESTSVVFRITFASTLLLQSLEYTNSSCALLVLRSSEVTMVSVDVHGITTSLANSGMFNFDEITSVVLQDWTIYDVHVENSAFLFKISRSSIQEINNLTITGIQDDLYPLRFEDSTCEFLSKIHIENCTKGIHFDESEVTNMTVCNFVNLGSSDIREGGAILSENSNITIHNSIFTNNTAAEGGAIKFYCSSSVHCKATIANNTFENNTAVQGGALHYNLYRPTFRNNTYTENTASYGRNIASYAKEIRIKGSNNTSIKFTNVGSGIVHNEEFTLALYDHDNQIMTLDDVSQITITGYDEGSSVLETNAVKVTKGQALFDDISFNAVPGSTNVAFNIKSSTMNLNMLKLQYGDDYKLEKLYIDFRWCEPGEIQTSNGICLECASGTYSFDWNATVCKNCLDDTTCPGGKEIDVDSGFWRKTTNSTTIVECPNEDACLGGYAPEDENPVTCDKGYEGLLCSECISTGDERYEQVDDFVCAKCPEPILNAFKVVGFLLLFLIFLVGLITININKKDVSQKSVLMRQLTNHIQILMLTLAYNLSFPKALTELFSPISRANSSSQTVVSFDCFASETELKLFTPSVSILKVFLASLSPLACILAALVMFAIFHSLFRKWFTDFKRNMVVSTITILYMLHPTVTLNAFSIFQCIDIDDNDSKVRIYLGIDCYSAEHLTWCLVCGVPSMIVWVFGLPIFALILLIKRRKLLDDPQTKRYFIVLYQGYKKETFYWEFVNIFRKIMLLSSNVFLARQPVTYKGAVALVAILVSYRAQIYLNPYTLNCNNELERLSIVASGMAIFGGLLFSSEEPTVPAIDVAVFILIIFLNVKFVLSFIYLMVKEFEDQYPSLKKLLLVLGTILMKHHDKNVSKLKGPRRSKKYTPRKKPKNKIRKLIKKKYKEDEGKHHGTIMRRRQKKVRIRDRDEEDESEGDHFNKMDVVVYMNQNECNNEIYQPQNSNYSPRGILKGKDKSKLFSNNTQTDKDKRPLNEFAFQRKSHRKGRIDVVDAYELDRAYKNETFGDVAKSSRRALLSQESKDSFRLRKPLERFRDDLPKLASDIAIDSSVDNDILLKKFMSNKEHSLEK